jgi:hypothetical protein
MRSLPKMTSLSASLFTVLIRIVGLSTQRVLKL